MLRITNPLGQSLELSKNTSIPVERNNALFSTDDSFVHDITYQATAGLTDNNKVFIQNGHLVEAGNGVYEFEVQVFVADYQFYRAMFTYKIVKGQIEYVLKVNFGALATKMKDVMLTDIYTIDAVPVGAASTAFMDLMKDTCLNPQNYPCSFFPVKNDTWNPSPNPIAGNEHYWLNEWDHANQRFIIETGSNTQDFGKAPFYKVQYILQKVFEYLKLDVKGSLFNSKEFKQIYLYTRRVIPGKQIEPSLAYMPKISIHDFLKQLRDRLKISMDFDLMTNTVTFESYDTIVNGDCNDISEYIESVDEISTAEQKGYTVTLKVDDSDEMANLGTADNPNYSPPSSLVVGGGENKVELEIGTLSQEKAAEYSYPISKQVMDNTFTGFGWEIDEWQLRLMQFKGMKIVSGGKFFPEATVMPLTDKDADWYRFLNDSKKVIITAKIPPGKVAMMKASVKIGCISKQGSFFYALPSKISYSMSNQNLERITVKIEAHTLVSDYNTNFFFVDNKPVNQANPTVWKYKAYWRPEIDGFNEVVVKRVAISGSTAVFGNSVIDKPTDDGGVGGTIGLTYVVSGTNEHIVRSETRVYSRAAPKYFVSMGVKGFFTQVNDYYLFPGGFGSNTIGLPVWIVF